MSLDEVGRSISYPEAIDLVAELERDFGSHLNASINDWAFAAGYGEVMGAITASSTINANRDPKKHPDPIRLPMPYRDEATKTADVTPEERAALRADLVRRSAFSS